MAKIRRKRSPDSYCRRTYRQEIDSMGLHSFRAKVRDTDLYILADRDIGDRATDLVLNGRQQIEKYISAHPEFLHSLVPFQPDLLAPPLVQRMIQVTRVCGVGPMAAVAGTIAEFVGKGLEEYGCCEVIVENGGDNYLSRSSDCTVAIFAGESPLSMNVGIRLTKEQMPAGVCTSSGTIGHSLSLGLADSVTVLGSSTALADAAATRLGNEMRDRGSIEKVLEVSLSLQGVDGCVVICGEQLGAIGKVELVRLDTGG